MLLNRIISIFTPQTCLSCEAEGEVICTTCLALVAPAPEGRERLAGRSLREVSVGAAYRGVVKELIINLKFHRLRAAAGPAARLVLAGLPDHLQPDLVTWVPIPATRYRERGYNQSELIGRQVAAALGVPCAHLLARTTSAHQTGMDRLTRLQQVRGAFYALKRLDGQRLLIVDDVATTGATLSECADVLVEAGAGPVWGAVSARH